jgi:high-affinity iron transporter
MIHPVLIGSAVGAGIGVSIGVLFYYFLVSSARKYGTNLTLLVLSLVGGSMISQAVQQLTQANWIEATHPIWDTSAIIPEPSIQGQLLYALMGYEATPTLIQAISYVIAILLVWLCWALPKREQAL